MNAKQAIDLAVKYLISEEKRLRVSAQSWERVVKDGRYLHEYGNCKGAHARRANIIEAIQKLEEIKASPTQGRLL